MPDRAGKPQRIERLSERHIFQDERQSRTAVIIRCDGRRDRSIAPVGGTSVIGQIGSSVTLTVAVVVVVPLSPVSEEALPSTVTDGVTVTTAVR